MVELPDKIRLFPATWWGRLPLDPVITLVVNPPPREPSCIIRLSRADWICISWLPSLIRCRAFCRAWSLIWHAWYKAWISDGSLSMRHQASTGCSSRREIWGASFDRARYKRVLIQVRSAPTFTSECLGSREAMTWAQPSGPLEYSMTWNPDTGENSFPHGLGRIKALRPFWEIRQQVCPICQ